MSDLFAKYKIYIIVVAIVAVLAIGTWAVLKFTSLGKKMDERIVEEKLGKALDSEIAKEAVTLTPADAELHAQRLYTAMKGMGTDEDAIYSVFLNLKTKGDVLYLIQVFGVKDHETLVQWITSELNSKERTKLNSILANKNIDYTF